ncbi:MAG: hypothetical protein NWF14_06025 [Candidatus Bathyarchaeota archaeon]|nr:hypothetical protein [Candidatus Bathyarchaeota archaeon]
MSDDTFRRFLESEAEKNPLRIEGYVNKAQVLKDAKLLAKRISFGDYETIKKTWRSRSFASTAFVLRKYGFEFKGITYMETLVNELSKLMERKKGSQ